MSIELLWILPIVGFGSFLFLVAYTLQHKPRTPADGLADTPERFKRNLTGGVNHDGRLSEVENAVAMMTRALSDQQKVVDQIRKENTAYTDEINGLKGKLRELHKEYDIVMSENYALRAKVKKITDTAITGGENRPPSHSSKTRAAGKVNMKLYEDTRLYNVSGLEDSPEIDFAESV